MGVCLHARISPVALMTDTTCTGNHETCNFSHTQALSMGKANSIRHGAQLYVIL